MRTRLVWIALGVLACVCSMWSSASMTCDGNPFNPTNTKTNKKPCHFSDYALQFLCSVLCLGAVAFLVYALVARAE